jgi:hypothetical protein
VLRSPSPACFKLGFAISAVREVLILSGAGFVAQKKNPHQIVPRLHEQQK